jgi:hypothetical protein
MVLLLDRFWFVFVLACWGEGVVFFGLIVFLDRLISV